MALYGDCLFTTRLHLRRPTREALLLIAGWSRSPEACGPYLSCENLDPEQLFDQLKSGAMWNDKEKRFVIHRNGLPIGCIRYWTPCGQLNTAMISVKVAVPSHRGKGFGTEAQKFLIKHLMENENIHQIHMYTDINNTPQQRCLRKLGFEAKEALRYHDQALLRDGLFFILTLKNFKRQPIYRYHNE